MKLVVVCVCPSAPPCARSPSRLCGPTVTRKDLGVGVASSVLVTRRLPRNTAAASSPIPGPRPRLPAPGERRKSAASRTRPVWRPRSAPPPATRRAKRRGLRLGGPCRGGREPPSPRRSPCNSSRALTPPCGTGPSASAFADRASPRRLLLSTRCRPDDRLATCPVRILVAGAPTVHSVECRMRDARSPPSSRTRDRRERDCRFTVALDGYIPSYGVFALDPRPLRHR